MDSLRRTLQGVQSLTPTTRDLTSSLVERGGTEGLLRFFYNAALATSRYDGTSHIFPAHLIGGQCGLYRADEPPVQGCHGRFDYLPQTSTAKGSVLKARTKTQAAPGTPETPGAPTPAPGGGAGAGPVNLPALPSIPDLTPTPPSSGSGSGAQNGINGLLDFLLGG
jgi:hypothetical protein